MKKMMNIAAVKATTAKAAADKSAEANLKNEIFNHVSDLLEDFGHLTKGRYADGLQKIEEVFWNHKDNLIGILKKHPNYNGMLQIVIPWGLYRPIDPARCRGFVVWMNEQLNYPNYDDNTIERWCYDIVTEILAPITNEVEGYKDYTTLTRDVVEELEEITNEFSSNGLNIKIRFNAGTKLMKVIEKVCIIAGLDKVVDMQTYRWTTADGVTHSKLKDMGWKHWRAYLADGVNPFTKDVTVVLSVNPYDYFTMSFGKNWASCHTIDKENRRRCKKNYNGCYCAGTESYCLDYSTMIFYIVDKPYDEVKGTRPEVNDKLKRAVVYTNGNDFVVSRVYPDGRDGGDPGVRDNVNAAMKQIWGECIGVDPDDFKLYEGDAANFIDTMAGEHYQDYNEYNDVEYWYLENSKDTIEVGNDTICPDCGETHGDSEWLRCYDCREDIVRCAGCGSYITEYDSLYHDEYGDPYCGNCMATCDRCGSDVFCNEGEFVYRTGRWSNYGSCEFHCYDCLQTERVIRTANGDHVLADYVGINAHNGEIHPVWDLNQICNHCGNRFLWASDRDNCDHKVLSDEEVEAILAAEEVDFS